MNARVEKGLRWMMIAALGGVAACGTGGEERRPAPKPGEKPGVEQPTTPGGEKPGEAPAPPKGRGRGAALPAECFGPSALDTAAREQMADRICSADQGRSARGKAENRCAAVVATRSDGQIAGVLSAWSEAVARESRAAEDKASDPMVRDLSHLLHAGAMRLAEGHKGARKQASISPEPTPWSRAIDSAFHTEASAIAGGASYDRELVAREVEQQHRGLMLVDALSSRTRNADLKCEIEAARLMAETGLDQACWVWSSMGHVTGTHARSRGQATPQESGSGQAAPAPQESGSGQAAPAPQESGSGQAAPAPQESGSGQGTGEAGDCLEIEM